VGGCGSFFRKNPLFAPFEVVFEGIGRGISMRFEAEWEGFQQWVVDGMMKCIGCIRI